MDLSVIRTLKIVDDDRFLRAKPEQLATMEYRFRDGVVMKPRVKGGRIVGFTATDKNGKPRPVIHMELRGSKECFYCECDTKTGVCRCLPVKCMVDA